MPTGLQLQIADLRSLTNSGWEAKIRASGVYVESSLNNPWNPMAGSREAKGTEGPELWHAGCLKGSVAGRAQG